MTKKASNDLTSQCGFDKDPSALLALLMLRRERAENTHALWVFSAAPRARLLCPNPFFVLWEQERTLRAGRFHSSGGAHQIQSTAVKDPKFPRGNHKWHGRDQNRESKTDIKKILWEKKASSMTGPAKVGIKWIWRKLSTIKLQLYLALMCYRYQHPLKFSDEWKGKNRPLASIFFLKFAIN